LSATDQLYWIDSLSDKVGDQLIRFTSDAPGIVGVSASRSSTCTTLDASTLTAAHDEDDDDGGHISDGHNAPNNDGVPGLATFGATVATRTLDASTLTAVRDEDDDDGGHIGDGHNAPNNDGVSGLYTGHSSILNTI
jgi:hypothetical protein